MNFLSRKRKLPRAGGDDERLVQLLDHNGVDLVIDVGANEGQYARRLRGAGYRRGIVSIEPGLSAYTLLCEAAANDGKWQVAPRMALGASDGRATLHVSDRSDMNSLRAPSQTMSVVFPKLTMLSTDEIDVRRLDGVFHENEQSFRGTNYFLKIDTQGSEDAVIEGARGILDRVVGLQIEMSLAALYEGQVHALEIMKSVYDMGFELHYVIGGFFSRTLARQMEIDGVFFRKSEGR